MARARRSQVRALVRRDGDDLAEQHHAGADVVRLERRVGLAPQFSERLGDAAGVLLDLRLELDGGFGEIGALEGLSAATRNGTKQRTQR